MVPGGAPDVPRLGVWCAHGAGDVGVAGLTTWPRCAQSAPAGAVAGGGVQAAASTRPGARRGWVRGARRRACRSVGAPLPAGEQEVMTILARSRALRLGKSAAAAAAQGVSATRRRGAGRQRQVRRGGAGQVFTVEDARRARRRGRAASRAGPSMSAARGEGPGGSRGRRRRRRRRLGVGVAPGSHDLGQKRSASAWRAAWMEECPRTRNASSSGCAGIPGAWRRRARAAALPAARALRRRQGARPARAAAAARRLPTSAAGTRGCGATRRAPIGPGQRRARH